MMIWHIFKKDLKLQWPFVLGLALADAINATLQGMLGHFPNFNVLQPVFFLNGFITVATFLLVVAVVQLDPVPEDRQDWLVRPIRRWDLLLSKLLFVVVCIHGPLFAANFYQGLASGLSSGQALDAALSWNAYDFVKIGMTGPPRFPGTLAALAIGAATRSVGQALALGMVGGVGGLLVAGGLRRAIYGDFFGGLNQSGGLAQWILALFVVLVSAAVVLSLQYFHRATRSAWIVICVGLFLVWSSLMLMPPALALATQSAFSSAPGRGVSISFVPEARKHQFSATSRYASLAAQGFTPVYLPLNITGISPDLNLVAEGVHATFTAADGARAESDPDVLSLPVHVPGQADAPTPLYQVFGVPDDFYSSHSDQPIRIDVDITFGILRPSGRYELPPVRGAITTPEGVSCETRQFPNRGITLGCIKPGNLPIRVSADLVDHASGLGNPVFTQFMPGDAPYAGGLTNVITQFGFTLPFRSSETGSAYPVTAAQIASSSVVLMTSKPLTHVMRSVTIPNLKLSEWTAEFTGAGH